jgi:iron only hydrogenase large subunit-like protein
LLAYSGCVTTAETILLEHQSTGEMLKMLREDSGVQVVVSVSPQSRASLAAHFKCPPDQVYKGLSCLDKERTYYILQDADDLLKLHSSMTKHI